MKEYLVKESTMKNLADASRGLSGTTISMKPERIIEDLEAVQTEMIDQGDSLNELLELIVGKADPDSTKGTYVVTANAAGGLEYSIYAGNDYTGG